MLSAHHCLQPPLHVFSVHHSPRLMNFTCKACCSFCYLISYDIWRQYSPIYHCQTKTWPTSFFIFNFFYVFCYYIDLQRKEWEENYIFTLFTFYFFHPTSGKYFRGKKRDWKGYKTTSAKVKAKYTNKYFFGVMLSNLEV